MRKTWAVVRRELIAYFSSPLAYVVMAAFLLMQGFVFYLIVSFLNQPGGSSMMPLRLFFGGTIFFWFFLVVIPLITMRLIAEELRSGTIEVLMTSPLTEGQVVVGKFLAAWVFYLALWLPTMVYVLLLDHYHGIDFGPVASSYLGVALFGVLYIGVGLFASTLSKNQIIAATIGFAGLVLLFSVGLVEQLLVSSSGARAILSHMNLWDHMDTYARGIVDTRHVVYELSLGLLFLFLAAKSLEVKKWR
jgi:ABC-2 type transport system permease protein